MDRPNKTNKHSDRKVSELFDKMTSRNLEGGNVKAFKNYVTEVAYNSGLGLNDDEKFGIVDKAICYFSGFRTDDYSRIRERILLFVDCELEIIAHYKTLSHSQDPQYAEVFWRDIVFADDPSELLTDWVISRLNSMNTPINATV